jgi:murein DD-endopeptidase MepM/ murein hydrolase activator NlpD
MTVMLDKGARGLEVNVNLLAEDHDKKHDRYMQGGNRFLQPRYCEGVLNSWHREKGIDYSWGSYGENRGYLWRDTPYGAGKACIHLGEDINVPVGTEVVAGAQCEVVHRDADCPQQYGWGNRVIVKLRGVDAWIIYAHLSHGFSCRRGDILAKGATIGYVGSPEENGGWYPHLHVQAMTMAAWKRFENDPESVDGYCTIEEWQELRRIFPRPSTYVKLIARH